MTPQTGNRSRRSDLAQVVHRLTHQPYNGHDRSYNVGMSISHVMTVSRNGQVSIPAETRARWNTRKVLVVDLGDRIVMRPASTNPARDLMGKYRGHGPSSDAARAAERKADREREKRH